MKKSIFALLLTFVSITAFAQRQSSTMTPEQRAENQTKTLKQQLELTEDQEKKVYELSLTRAKKMQELRATPNSDRSERRSSMETFNNEIAKILTVEQQEKYKTMQDDRRGGQRGPREEN